MNKFLFKYFTNLLTKQTKVGLNWTKQDWCEFTLQGPSGFYWTDIFKIEDVVVVAEISDLSLVIVRPSFSNFIVLFLKLMAVIQIKDSAEGWK